jgi:hypothetical protein
MLVVRGQCHAPAALYPEGKERRYPLDTRLRSLHPVSQNVNDAAGHKQPDNYSTGYRLTGITQHYWKNTTDT